MFLIQLACCSVNTSEKAAFKAKHVEMTTSNIFFGMYPMIYEMINYMCMLLR